MPFRLFDAGSRGRDPALQTVHDRVFTVANAVSFLRLLGLPLFVWLMVGPQAYGQALTVLIVVGTTDWIDGFIARRFDQVTRLGKIMDPLLDRALLATAAITLAALGLLPVWILLVVVGRDAVLVIAGFMLFRGPPPIPVTRVGKFATACLLIGVPGFLVAGMDFGAADAFSVVAWTTTLIGVVAYYVAGVQYAHIAYTLTRRT